MKENHMWPDLQDSIESVLVLVARAALALFLSSLFGMLIYIISLPIVQSIWEVREINFALYGVLAIGFGAGLGSFLGWMNRDLRNSLLLLMLFLSIAAAMLGAWGGLYTNRDVFKLVGRPGIPALTGIIVGAILGGNIFNLVVWVAKTLRHPRI